MALPKGRTSGPAFHPCSGSRIFGRLAGWWARSVGRVAGPWNRDSHRSLELRVQALHVLKTIAAAFENNRTFSVPGSANVPWTTMTVSFVGLGGNSMCYRFRWYRVCNERLILHLMARGRGTVPTLIRFPCLTDRD